MRFEVLGPLQVRTDDGSAVTVREPKVRALLADLLVHHGQPVSPDRLVDDLWGEAVPGNAANTLQTKVSQLRRALELAEPGGRGLVVRRPAGYLLHVPEDAVDSARFTAMTEHARRTGGPRDRAALLTDALALWRGPAFAEFRDEDFARAAAARLDEQRLSTLEELSGIRLALGEHRLLAAELGEAVRRHPLREALRGVYMRALYRSGRQADALESYRELTEHLAGELGLDPGPELVELHRAILRQDPVLAAAPTPALPAPALPAPARAASAPAAPPAPHTDVPRTDLPGALTPLIGRQQDVGRVRGLIASGRLVTLTGPGGVGKTRIALETAATAAESFPDGVRLVELAAERPDAAPATAGTTATTGPGASARTAEAVAEALGLREHPVGANTAADAEEPSPRHTADRIVRALGDRRVLLVLDNCEHLVQPVAELVEHLLRLCPGLSVLATSREPLALSGETLHAVGPLPESDAVRLFTARAAAAAPGFALGPANADAVARICARLDGIPLALELAAARVRALGVHGLAERLGDRFRLLTAGRRDAPARQQTLRAVIDWSWGLLTNPERAVLSRLAVFADGCTLAAAEEVCAAPEAPGDTVLDVITRLVDRSLVTVVDGQDGPRYRLLESVAAYALERLHEAGATRTTRRLHRLHYTELAERAEPCLHGPDQRRRLRLLDADGANLRRALADAAGTGEAAGDAAPDLALRQVNALSWYWFLRGRLTEARRSLDTALSATGPHPGDASARARRAGFALLTGERTQQGGPEAPDELFEGADVRARWFLTFTRSGFGDPPGPDRADTLLSEFRARDDRWGIAATMSTLATQAVYRGGLGDLRRYATDSAARFADVGDGWGRLQAAEQLGVLAEIAGDYEEAGRLHREGAAIAEELQLWTDLSFRLSRLGRIALLTGDHRAADELHRRARQLAAGQSHGPAEQFATTGLALTARRQGRLDAAEEYLRPWLDWNRRLGVDSGAALILAELGFIAEQRGHTAQARELHRQGLAAAERTGDPRAVALALEGLAGAEACAGRHAAAARLLGTADTLRASAGAPLPGPERGDVDRITALALEALGEEAHTTAFHEGRTLRPDDHPAASPA
ncbi:AfsR/SARP family transcriptional regulator [Streptomyces sp. NBC_00158]|uniref:AfsR/SARP family transcriptional regulator n=1 Tax=Streptomyces sp. NBC_00158 TaxID=2903627 RepID=UPI003248285B